MSAQSLYAHHLFYSIPDIESLDAFPELSIFDLNEINEVLYQEVHEICGRFLYH